MTIFLTLAVVLFVWNVLMFNNSIRLGRCFDLPFLGFVAASINLIVQVFLFFGR